MNREALCRINKAYFLTLSLNLIKSLVDMVDDYILVQEFDPMGGLCRRLSIYSHILKSRPM